MKIIVAGCRDYTDEGRISAELDYYIGAIAEPIIVQGGAKGVDAIAKEWAITWGFPWVQFDADWNKHGNAAGPIRNRQMAEYSEMLIAFWDGKSRGTKNMIDEATKRNLIVIIVRFDEETSALRPPERSTEEIAFENLLIDVGRMIGESNLTSE